MALLRRSLRKDPLDGEIGDPASRESLMRALEAAGLVFAEIFFKRLGALGLDPADPELDLALKALGHQAGSMGMSRLAWMTGRDETGARRSERSPHPEDAAYGEAIRRVLFEWLLVWDPTNPKAAPHIASPSVPRPTVRLDLDELWDTARPSHRRLRNAGMTGPGRERTMARETTRSVD